MKTLTKTTWRKVKLGDFINVNPLVQLQRGKEYPFLDMADVVPLSRTMDWQKTKVFSGAGARFEDGDTLFARITPCLENGKITQVLKTNGPGFGSTEFYVLRGKDKVSVSDFIFYLTRTYHIRKLAESSMVGASGRQRVERAAFKNIEVEVPENINDQKRIAAILSAFDDKIEVNNKINQNLEQMAQAIFKEWFVNFKFPGHEKVKMVDSELGKIPKGWEIIKLGEVADLIKGQKPKDVLGHSAEGTIEYLLIDSFITNAKFYTTDLNTPKCRIGDPVIVMDGASSGKVFFGKDGAVGSTLAIFRPKKSVSISDQYLFMFLKQIESEMLDNLTGSAIPHLDKDFLKSHLFIIPDKETMKKITQILSEILNRQMIVVNENQKLATLRDTLLPKLMSGEIRVIN